MTSGAIHVAQVPESGWPCPLPPPLGCNLSTNRKRKPKWRRCVAASIAVGPSAILTGSRTRPSDWGANARFGLVEDRRNNRRLAPFTCTPCVLQIWLSPFSSGCHLSAPQGLDAAKVEKHIEPLGQRGARLLAQKSSIFGVDADRTDLVDDSDCLYGLACPSAVLDRLFKWPPA